MTDRIDREKIGTFDKSSIKNGVIKALWKKHTAKTDLGMELLKANELVSDAIDLTLAAVRGSTPSQTPTDEEIAEKVLKYFESRTDLEYPDDIKSAINLAVAEANKTMVGRFEAFVKEYTEPPSLLPHIPNEDAEEFIEKLKKGV